MSEKKTYPENLLRVLHFNESFDTEIDYERLTEDQISALEYLLSCIPQREKAILLCCYRDGMTRKEAAKEFQLSQKRINQLVEHGKRKIQSMAWEWGQYVVDGYRNRTEKLTMQLVDEEKYFCKSRGIQDEHHIYWGSVSELKLSRREIYALNRSGIFTVRELLTKILYKDWSYKVRGLGLVSENNISAALQKENLLPDNYGEIAWDECIPCLDRELRTFKRLNRAFG